ncbi:MAG: pilus assembly protein [Alphaproteobacteria bacterium]|nr:pilus assembly protein [Alphaproteobacteria bacterium]
MFNLLNRSRSRARAALGCRRAVAAVEFALFTPLLFLVMVGLFEFGYYLNQSIDLDKSLRVGVMLAARSALPLSADVETTIGNLVKTGTTDGTGDFIVPGWSNASASLTITTTTYSADDTDYEVIRVVASVPYEPMFATFLEGYGLATLNMNAAHEQAYVGN